MAVRVKRGLGEAGGSILCFLMVLVTLMAVDQRVRERFTHVFNQASGMPLTTWTDRLQALGGVVVQAAREQSLEHAPLLIFTVVATVLVLFMLRT